MSVARAIAKETLTLLAGIEPSPRSIVAAGLIGSCLRGLSAMC